MSPQWRRAGRNGYVHRIAKTTLRRVGHGVSTKQAACGTTYPMRSWRKQWAGTARLCPTCITLTPKECS